MDGDDCEPRSTAHKADARNREQPTESGNKFTKIEFFYPSRIAARNGFRVEVPAREGPKFPQKSAFCTDFHQKVLEQWFCCNGTVRLLLWINAALTMMSGIK